MIKLGVLILLSLVVYSHARNCLNATVSGASKKLRTPSEPQGEMVGISSALDVPLPHNESMLVILTRKVTMDGTHVWLRDFFNKSTQLILGSDYITFEEYPGVLEVPDEFVSKHHNVAETWKDLFCPDLEDMLAGVRSDVDDSQVFWD